MSNKKIILIRADNSSAIGLGHLMRTLLLADGLKEHFKIIFLSRILEGSQNHLITQRGFDLQILQTMVCDEIVEYLQKFAPALCIVDHYGITPDCETKLCSLCKLLVFDDEFKIHHCDAILNHSFIAEKSDYDYLPYPKILAGSKYTLLKSGFFEHRNRFIPLKSLKHKKVLITLGGTDVLGASLSLKKTLLAIEKSLIVDIATTSANPKLKSWKYREKHLIIDTIKMDVVMQKYDLIITSTSTSLLETYALKKPFIGIQCAKNQQKTVDILQQAGLRNIMKRFNPAALKKALNFVQFRPYKIKRMVERYHFTRNGAAKEIVEWLT